MSNRVSYLIIAKDRFSKVANKIAASTGKMNNGFKKTGKLTKKGGGFKTMLGWGAGAATASLGLMGTAIKKGGDFEEAMAKVSAITGTQGDKLIQLGDNVSAMAKKYGMAGVTVADTAALVASSNSTLLDDMKGYSTVIDKVLTLAKGSSIAPSVASEALMGGLNQYNRDASYAERYMNVLAAGSKVGASLLPQTTIALNKAGKDAADANITFEQLQGSIQVLGQFNQKGEVAGTGFKGMLNKLAEARAAFDPARVGFFEALQNMSDANLSVPQINDMVGQENKKVTKILIDNIPLLKEWTTEVTGTRIAHKQAAVMMGTFKHEMGVIGATMDGKFVQLWGELANDVRLLSGEFQEFLATIDGDAIKTFGERLGYVLDFFKAIGGAVNNVIVSIEYMAGLLASVGKVGGGKGGFLGTGGSASEYWAGIKNAFSGDGLDEFSKGISPFLMRESPELAFPSSQIVPALNKVEVKIDVNDPKKNIRSVQAKSLGKNLDVGTNMMPQGA